MTRNHMCAFMEPNVIIFMKKKSEIVQRDRSQKVLTYLQASVVTDPCEAGDTKHTSHL